MKKCFTTGLILLLPLTLTIILIVFLIKIITTPFIGPVTEILSNIPLFNQSLLFLSAPQVLFYSSRLLTLGIFFLFIFTIGLLGQWMVFRYVISFTEKIFQKIPFFNKIYTATREVVKTLFEPDGKNFHEVVLVGFPHENTLTMALTFKNSKNLDSQMVFIPATPNPTMGFLVQYPKEDIKKTDIKLEEALKFVISCGLIPMKLPKNLG